MKILVYSVIFKNKQNIVRLVSNLQNLNIKLDLLIINNSPVKVNINSIRRNIKIINNFKNNFYVGAFNQAISYAEKKRYSHLIHINDDIFMFKNIFQNLVGNIKFKNSIISPTQCDSKKNIISNGSKINPLLGNIVWETKNSMSLSKGFCPQGSFFSLPIKNYHGFRIPKMLRNYCEEMYLGYFFKEKSLNSYFLTKQRFIHFGADKEKKFSSYKAFHITRNNILILKKFSSTNKFLYIKLFFYIFKSLLNIFYRILINPSYANSLWKGIYFGIKESL